MEAAYRRELNRTQLIFEAAGIREKDYQIYMLEENQPEGILKVSVQGVGNKTQYKYDISGKISIRALYEKTGMQYDEICQMVMQLMQVIKNLEACMLNADKIILEPEYIFYERGQFLFCYYPLHTGNLYEAFRELSSYFIRQADCEDKKGICIAYELHRITSQENYCLEQVMKQVYSMEQEREQEIEEQEEAEEDISYVDMIEEREMGIGVLRESRKPFGRLTELLGWKK